MGFIDNSARLEEITKKLRPEIKTYFNNVIKTHK
jgi:hypothetical protein